MTPFLRPSESAHYHHLRADHLAELPHASNDPKAFDAYIHALWNLQRLQRIESAIEYRARRPLLAIDDPALIRTLDRLQTARQLFERIFYQSLHTLLSAST